MKNSIFLLFLIASVFPIVLPGQIEPKIDGMNWEAWHDPVPVSGRLEVGYMNFVDSSTLIPSTFFSSLPSTHDGVLCVEVYSQDGVYEAQREYVVPDVKEARVEEFKWPTEYYKELKTFNRSEVVILASIGKGCKDNEKIYVPSGWEKQNPEADLLVFLNSDKETYIRIKDGTTRAIKTIKCRLVKGNRGVAYNLTCVVPSSNVKGGNEYFIVQRKREATKVKYINYPFFIKK